MLAYFVVILFMSSIEHLDSELSVLRHTLVRYGNIFDSEAEDHGQI